MTRPTMLVLAPLVVLLPGATVRADTTAKTPPATAGVRQLQCAWEGFQVGQESAGPINITFDGNALRFQGSKADLRYDATFTLKKGTRPQQLHATITSGGPAGNDIGKVIGAVFKIENGTLSLAGIEDDAPSTVDDSEAFDRNPMFHYRLRRVDPQSKKAGSPGPEAPASPAPWSPLKWPE
jgi:hypothetical protein